MAKKNQHMNDGGAHTHETDAADMVSTKSGGEHDHIFVLNGHLVTTEKSGAHAHALVDKAVGAETQKHVHTVRIGDDVMETRPAGPHDHTSNKGCHCHALELLDGTVVESVVPGDLMDAGLRKRLNLEIQAIAMSKDRFLTFERAAAWLDDHGMVVGTHAEHETEFLFTQGPRDRFEESSLKTIDLMDGVRAVVGFMKEEAGPLEPQPVHAEEIAFDQIQALVVSESPILNDAQVEQLANLREDLAASMAGTVAQAAKALPLLMQFIESVLGSTVAQQAMLALVDRVAGNMLATHSVLSKVALPEAQCEEETLPELVRKLAASVAPLEEAFAESSFERLHLLLKSCRLTFTKAAEEVWKLEEAPAVVKEAVLAPTKEMSREQKQAALQTRCEKFGIEVTPDASLTFPAGFPTELEKFGDPVNLKFPMAEEAGVKKARGRFKQFANEIYKGDISKVLVHERIVRKMMELGITPGFDPEDKLDAMFSTEVKEAIKAHHTGTHNAAVVETEVEKKWFIPIKKAAGEQRIVHGIVLEPDVTDLQGDTYDEETVKEAAWVFMEDFTNAGLMHEELVNDKVRILESYVTPINLALPVDGGTFNIRKGTWLMTWRIKDDQLWSDIKEGKLTGFSIGAKANVTNLVN